MEISAGKFCRFKPRTTWPPALQQSIAEEKLYFMHPVIILDSPCGGLVDVVTTTSSPALTKKPANYIRISTSGGKLPMDLHEPFLVNHKLPKESWVVLDSKRRFAVTILEPWVESKVHFALTNKNMRKRLRECVEARMKAVREQAQISAIAAVSAAAPSPPPPKPCDITSTNPWARAMAPPGPPPSIPLPPLPPPTTAVKFQAPTPPARTTSLPSAAAAPSSPDLDIREIKKSLAGLKVAVAALEGLCEKLEQKIEPTPPALLSSSPEHTPTHALRNDKAARMLGMGIMNCTADSTSAAEKPGNRKGGGKEEGKTSRLKRWGSRLFLARESQ